MAVGLIACGPAWRQGAGENLDVGRRNRRQLVLRQRADRDFGAAVVTNDAGSALLRGAEKVTDLDAERSRYPLQRFQRRANAPALELAEKALRNTGSIGSGLEGQSACQPQFAQNLTDWPTRGLSLRCDRPFSFRVYLIVGDSYWRLFLLKLDSATIQKTSVVSQCCFIQATASLQLVCRLVGNDR